MELYHGSGEKVEFPEIRKSRQTKDFSWGFYCTNHKNQAKRWTRKWVDSEKTPTLNTYRYLENPSLKLLKFSEMNDQWLDFIAACRLGKTHGYDIVEGPMADDKVWNYVNEFLRGEISRTAFWELAKFDYPTHQMSFHSLQALECLTFVESEEILWR